MTAVPERIRVAIALAAVLIVTAWVYLPGLNGGYVFDDFPNIVDNAALHVVRLHWNDWVAAMLSSPSSAFHRPLAMLTFAINHYFTGLDPVPMKLTNIAIHLINTLLVFGLLRSLLWATIGGDDARRHRIGWAALLASAYWAVNPINLMAVLYIVQRMESLCHVFVFAGLWAYVAGRARQQRGAPGWGLILGGIAGGTLVGLLAKESAALLPVYALCLELAVFRFHGANQRRDPRVAWLYVAMLVLPAIVGMAWLLPMLFRHGAFDSRNFTMGQRLLTEPRVLFDYLNWTLLPALGQYGIDHDDVVVSHGLWDPPTTFFALLGIVALPIFAFLMRKRRPLVALGILWFLCAHLLTATIVPFELVFEHRNYFASVGVCLALADILLLAPAPGSAARKGAAVVALAFLLAFAGTTYLRANEWANPLRFASSEATKHPQSPRATYSLVRTLIVMSNYDPASPWIKPTLAAIDRARQVPNCGILPDQAGLLFAARTQMPIDPILWTDMQDKLRRYPVGPEEISALRSLTDCTIARECTFDADAMVATFGAAMSHGDIPDVLSVYGNYVLNILGDDALAMRVWKQASLLAPAEAQYRSNVIKLQIAQGRYDEARTGIAELRRLGGLGQHASEADTLDARLQKDMQSHPQSSPR